MSDQHDEKPKEKKSFLTQQIASSARPPNLRRGAGVQLSPDVVEQQGNTPTIPQTRESVVPQEREYAVLPPHEKAEQQARKPAMSQDSVAAVTQSHENTDEQRHDGAITQEHEAADPQNHTTAMTQHHDNTTQQGNDAATLQNSNPAILQSNELVETQSRAPTEQQKSKKKKLQSRTAATTKKRRAAGLQEGATINRGVTMYEVIFEAYKLAGLHMHVPYSALLEDAAMDYIGKLKKRVEADKSVSPSAYAAFEEMLRESGLE